MNAEDAATPMMAQYLDIKSGYPDALLFYRMGDFYEMFFDDAVAAAAALDIALTKRGKHLGDDIPMCGVPVHAAEGYLLTLIRKGFRVAIAEQMEDPAEAKKRGYKAVVKRDVVRLVTPGTLTEESLLEARRHNFLAAFCEVRGEGALAWVDISTGAFRVAPCAGVRLGPELARLGPREVLVSEGLEPSSFGRVVSESGAAMTPLARASFDSTSAEGRLMAALGVGTLDAFGSFTRAEVGAMGAIVAYLELTQRGKLPLLRPPQREVETASVQIDAATRRNLELTRACRAGGRGRSWRHRPDGDGGRRAASGAADRGALAGSGRDPRPAREARRAGGGAGGAGRLRAQAAGGAGHRPGAVAAGAGPGRAARSGGDPERAGAGGRGGRDAAGGLRRGGGALRGTRRSWRCWMRRWWRSRRLLARDGGFIAAGYDAELDEARELRDEGRGVIAGCRRSMCRPPGSGR
jgi:DNA mismatch repair protein MutS